MKWTKIKPKENFTEHPLVLGGFNGDFYEDHLLILGRHLKSEPDLNNELMLCCWDISIS